MHFVITILQAIVSMLLLIAAGMAKACMDESAEGRFTGMRSSRNKVTSYLQKWKLDKRGNRIPHPGRLWYYCYLFTPQYVERFPFSSTWAAALTDYWHRQQFICFNCLYLAFAASFFPEPLAMAAAFTACKLVNLSFGIYRRYALKNRT